MFWWYSLARRQTGLFRPRCNIAALEAPKKRDCAGLTQDRLEDYDMWGRAIFGPTHPRFWARPRHQCPVGQTVPRSAVFEVLDCWLLCWTRPEASRPMAPTVQTAKCGTVWPTGALVRNAKSKTSVWRWCDGQKIALLTFYNPLRHFVVASPNRPFSEAWTAAPLQTALFEDAPSRLANFWYPVWTTEANGRRDPWLADSCKTIWQS